MYKKYLKNNVVIHKSYSKRGDIQQHSAVVGGKRVEGGRDEKRGMDTDEDEDEDRQVNGCEVDLCKTIAWRWVSCEFNERGH